MLIDGIDHAQNVLGTLILACCLYSTGRATLESLKIAVAAIERTPETA